MQGQLYSAENYNFLSLIFHYHDTSLLSDKHAICQQNSQHFLELINTYNFDKYNYAVYHSINTVQSTLTSVHLGHLGRTLCVMHVCNCELAEDS